MAGSYRVILAKQDFNFSAAHFTLFGDGTAEALHGHNYRVAVELVGPNLDADGLLIGFEATKAAIRRLCAGLDGRVLIPEGSPRLRLEVGEKSVEVRWQERIYRFPRDEVVLLPLRNTTIELLARMFWEELAPPLRQGDLLELAVSVEETAGQRCLYSAPLVARAGSSAAG